MEIFRAYDIRGRYPKEVNEDVAYRIGLGFATYIGNEGKVSVGRDVRNSSKKLQENLIKGLKDGGLTVIDLGLITTPMLYFSVLHYDLKGGIMVTASHNPPEWNGFKLCKEKGEMVAEGKGMEELKDIIMKAKFKRGEGKEEKEEKFFEEYTNYLIKKVKIKREVKGLADLSNGSCAFIVPKLFKELNLKMDFINQEVNGNFPSHLPEPNEETLKPLARLVKEGNYEFGVGYDGDGDRAVFLDNNGRIIRGDIILALLSKYYLKDTKGSVVFDVASSNVVKEVVESLGGRAIISRVGHAYIKEEMIKNKALIGGEVSSHLYFGEIFGLDDSIFATLKIMELLSSTSKSFSDLLNELPKYFTTPVINFECPDEFKFLVIKEIIEELKTLNINTLDGVKVNFEDGWFLIRASNTLPQIKLVAEARSEKRLEEILDFAKRVLIKRLKAYLNL